MLPAMLFVFAPLPNVLCVRCGISDDFLNDTQSGFVDSGYFLTAMMVVSGIAFPLVLENADMVVTSAMLQCIGGGLTVYGTMIAYQSLFGPEEDY